MNIFSHPSTPARDSSKDVVKRLAKAKAIELEAALRGNGKLQAQLRLLWGAYLLQGDGLADAPRLRWEDILYDIFEPPTGEAANAALLEIRHSIGLA